MSSVKLDVGVGILVSSQKNRSHASGGKCVSIILSEFFHRILINKKTVWTIWTELSAAWGWNLLKNWHPWSWTGGWCWVLRWVNARNSSHFGSQVGKVRGFIDDTSLTKHLNFSRSSSNWVLSCSRITFGPSQNAGCSSWCSCLNKKSRDWAICWLFCSVGSSV